MISEKRRQAARANGAKSRGPKTPEGKARSSRNATRHGLRSKQVVLPNESADDFRRLLASYIDRFAPRDLAEHALVEEMVAALWRVRRARTVETRTLDAALDSISSAASLSDRVTAAFSQALPGLSLLHSYEFRYDSIFWRAFRRLKALRRSPLPRPHHSGVTSEPKKPFVSNAGELIQPPLLGFLRASAPPRPTQAAEPLAAPSVPARMKVIHSPREEQPT